MPRFLHLDGHVTINDLMLPLEVFQRYEPDYVPPSDDWMGRDYTPGSRHVLFGSGNTISLPLSWPEGDAYIAKENYYRLLQQQEQTRSTSHVRSILHRVNTPVRRIENHARKQRQTAAKR